MPICPCHTHECLCTLPPALPLPMNAHVPPPPLSRPSPAMPPHPSCLTPGRFMPEGYSRIAELLRYKADPNIRDEAGQTVLHKVDDYMFP